MRFASILLLILLSDVASSQSAIPLYAIDGNFALDYEQTSTLYRIDPEDASGLEVVSDAGFNIPAVVYVTKKNQLLAITAPGENNQNLILKIDPQTAETIRSVQIFPVLEPIDLPYTFLSIAYAEFFQQVFLIAFYQIEEQKDSGVSLIGLSHGSAGAGQIGSPQGQFTIARSELDDRLRFVIDFTEFF